jgi:hypothetical protein
MRPKAFDRELCGALMITRGLARRRLFHVHDHSEIRDHVGIEVARLGEAKVHANAAVKIAKSLLAGRPFQIVASDESGAVVYELALSAQ